MKWQKAFGAGMLGAVAMSVIMAVARLAGMPANMSMMLGTMLGLTAGGAAWVVGFIMHLVISGALALVYGWVFERVVHHAGIWTGTAVSVFHIVVAGLFLGMMPAMHPAMPGMMNPPGIFLSNLGAMGVVAFVLLHIIYGMIVGGMYGETMHTAPAAGHAPEAHAPAH